MLASRAASASLKAMGNGGCVSGLSMLWKSKRTAKSSSAITISFDTLDGRAASASDGSTSPGGHCDGRIVVRHKQL